MVPAGLRPGFTLIELVVIIFVLLLFLGMAFIGATAWKRGADRSGCLLNIRHMQVAVRGFANSRGLHPGADTASTFPPLMLEAEIVGVGKFIPSTPNCPGKGLYTLGGNTVPPIGTLYMTCSLEETEDHIPSQIGSW